MTKEHVTMVIGGLFYQIKNILIFFLKIHVPMIHRKKVNLEIESLFI